MFHQVSAQEKKAELNAFLEKKHTISFPATPYTLDVETWLRKESMWWFKRAHQMLVLAPHAVHVCLVKAYLLSLMAERHKGRKLPI